MELKVAQSEEGGGGFTIRYGVLSHKGYYPDESTKPNQDAYAIKTMFTGSSQRSLFLVFDGHGKEGHLCAQFCKEYLPDYLEDTYCKLNETEQHAEQDLIEAVIRQSFLKCNDALHIYDKIDDSLSGTTVVGVLIDGQDMYIANVGDSRALVLQQHEGKLIAKPLSCDQTPYRRDERERVKAYGALVMSMEQLLGLKPLHENWGEDDPGSSQGVDPPRIWSNSGQYPGTAFTRSMGDEIAEDLGVIAEPEVIRKRIRPSDKFVIIASDGVFEFITNQKVADMVSEFSNPQEACMRIVEEAYSLWLQYETRTDDITIIILSIDDVAPISETGRRVSCPDLDSLALKGNRPVRREVIPGQPVKLINWHSMDNIPSEDWDESKKHNGDILSLDATYRIDDQILKKSSTERASIEAALQANFLFDNITEVQRNTLLDRFQYVHVSAGDYIIKEGDRGNCFYIVDSGKFEVRVRGDGGNEKGVTKENDHPAGSLLHVYGLSEEIKPCFGHLALLYSCPRSASVIACTDGSLWVLNGSLFRWINGRKSRREIARVLRRVDILQSLKLQQLSTLCDAFTNEEYEPGDYIIRQGEVGDTFFILEEGTARVTMNADEDDNSSPQREIRILNPYEYFGEKALLFSEPRSANVIAKSSVRCLALSKSAFEELLGPLQHVIDIDQKARARRNIPSFEQITLFGRVSAPYIEDAGKIHLCKDALERGLELSRLVTFARRPCSLAPFIAAYNESNFVHCIMRVQVVCSLSTLQNELGRRNLKLDAVRHCAACILIGLNAVHNSNVLFRGVTPEMIMLDRWGNSVLMDYRLSKLGTDSATTLCGAPEYLAPEQVRGAIYDKGVDFWMLGILIYELLHGSTPFATESEINTYEKIVAHTSHGLDYPPNFEPALCDLLDRLLCPDPKKRLGCISGDVAVMKNHQWFSELNWQMIGKHEPVNAELYNFANIKMNELSSSRSTPSSIVSSDDASFPLGGDSEGAPENEWSIWNRL